MEPTIQALFDSLQLHGFDYENVGLGKPWNGFQSRVQYYLEAAEAFQASHGPDAIAVYVDGFDSVCIQGPGAVLQKYFAKPRSPPILYGAEICCFRNCDKDMLSWYDVHGLKGGSEAIKTTLTPNPTYGGFVAPDATYLNGGMLMGPVKDLIPLFRHIRTCGIEDDQLAATDYLKKNPMLVDLDIEESIFRNKVKPREPLPDEGTAEGPCFLHFPGMQGEENQAALLGLYDNYDRK